MRRTLLIWLAIGCALLVTCAESDRKNPDRAPTGGRDVAPEEPSVAPADSGAETTADAPSDTHVDPGDRTDGPDTAADMIPDTPADVVPDTPADVIPDGTADCRGRDCADSGRRCPDGECGPDCEDVEERRTRFSSSSVPHGAVCTPQTQTRTCSSGAWTPWDGDALYQHCVVEPERPDAPRIGFQYLTWFGYRTTSGDCGGTGWSDNPFLLEGVKSLLFGPDGFCYSSMDPDTATVHAGKLQELRADFVVFDVTNFSKTRSPTDNPIFQSALRAMSGFAAHESSALDQYLGHAPRIRGAFQLSITCWGLQCHGLDGNHDEILTVNEFVLGHMEAIARQAYDDPGAFFHVDGRPLLLLYVNAGSSVRNLSGEPAFHGPGNLIPLVEDFDPVLDLGERTVRAREFFSVRYAILSAADDDYTGFSSEIWPFQCNGTRCSFAEAGYASVYSHSSGERSLALLDGFVSAAEGRDHLLVRVWNEFSSTDEFHGQAYTLEPNTRLHTVDSTPGNADPWFFFDGVRARVSGLVDYSIRAAHSGSCMDVRGVSAEDGAIIQQWECLGRDHTNQVWHLQPSGFGSHYILADHSGMCLTEDPGDSVVQRACRNLPAQRWQLALTGDAVRIQGESGRCVEVADHSHDNGALLRLGACLDPGTETQSWRATWY